VAGSTSTINIGSSINGTTNLNSPIVQISGNTASTNTSTGALVIAGGVGIGGNLNIGSALRVGGNFVADGNITLGDADTDTISVNGQFVNNTQLKTGKTNSNTFSLAAYDVDGASYTNLLTLTASNNPTITIASTAVGTINNMSIGASIRSTGAFTTLAANNSVTFTHNVESTSIGTGTLVVTGGVGISGNVWVGGTINGSFAGAVSGNADTATVATTITLVATNTTDGVHYITFVDTATGNENIRTDTNLIYNPNTNVLTAGTFSGNLSGNATTATKVEATVTGINSAELVRGNMGDSDQARILVGATASNAGYLEIATADDGTEPIHVRQYTGVFATLARTATLLDASGNTSFPGTVSASFTGNIGASTRGTGAFTTLAANGAVTFTQNTASTSSATGTLVVTGGVGVSGAIYAGSIQNTPVGSTTRSTGAFTTLAANNSVTFTQGTASTSTATGTLVVTGGIGVSGAIFAGGNINGNIVTTSISTGAATTAGTITGNWSLSANSQLRATYADLAENYVADRHYEPGTVLEFGGDFEVTLADDETRKVAGVVTTKPAYIMNDQCQGEYVVCIALQGRVPVKVRGKIRKGDLLVSGGDGFARSTDDPKIGTVIGKALENFDGEGVIEVSVGRQ
jgi:hypothetical protein